VTYTKTLVHCTDQTEQSTCTETEMVLDVWQPTNSTGAPYPIVMTVHGGAFVSGDQEDKDPPNAYFAERGFVCFAVQYRLAKDKGLYPKALRRWSPKTTQPKAHWTPFAQTMYPAVRDIKAALRWIHAHAAEYNGDITSLTLQGGSAGATAVIELALTGGDGTFAQDYTGELNSTEDRTLATANLDQPATATGLIDYWGAIFTEDLMHYKDGQHRWSASSLPTIAFHGTDDTTVSPATGAVLCGNLTLLGVACKLVSLPGQQHGCWGAKVALPSGKSEGIFDYAFAWMANTSNWTVIDAPPVTLTHYEDPAAGGCRSDETAVNITGVAGGFCSASCAAGSCPTDKPAGVTAVPTCTGQKICALACDPALDTARAGCGPAGNSMSCKPITSTGFVTAGVTAGITAGVAASDYSGMAVRPGVEQQRRLAAWDKNRAAIDIAEDAAEDAAARLGAKAAVVLETLHMGAEQHQPMRHFLQVAADCMQAWSPCTSTDVCCGSCTCTGGMCHPISPGAGSCGTTPPPGPSPPAPPAEPTGYCTYND
jgi:acetyl esterase/lipase